MLYAIAQLRSQFEAVVMDSDFARTFSGKISPVTTLYADGYVSFGKFGIGVDRVKDLPCDRPPRRCEEENVKANEGDGCLLCCNIVDNYVSCGILSSGCGS